MLVLTRKKYQTVVLADEITVTVEEISDGHGQHLFGARVRLGFQCPRHVSIDRSELRARGSGGVRSGETTRTAPPLEGRVSEVSDGQVRLRIQVPRRVPVCLNGTPTVGLDSEQLRSDATRTSTSLHRITCRQEDHVTICKNITIAALAIRCFEPSQSPVVGS